MIIQYNRKSTPNITKHIDFFSGQSVNKSLQKNELQKAIIELPKFQQQTIQNINKEALSKKLTTYYETIDKWKQKYNKCHKIDDSKKKIRKTVQFIPNQIRKVTLLQLPPLPSRETQIEPSRPLKNLPKVRTVDMMKTIEIFPEMVIRQKQLQLTKMNFKNINQIKQKTEQELALKHHSIILKSPRRKINQKSSKKKIFLGKLMFSSKKDARYNLQEQGRIHFERVLQKVAEEGPARWDTNHDQFEN